MDSVGMFVKIIIITSFIWCIAEVVLPENSMQKYLSFIYGLIIIALTVSAFSKINIDDFFVVLNTEDYAEYNSTYLEDLYEDKLEDILAEKFDDNSIEVELDSEYKIENIKCKNKKTYDDIMRYLNE